MPARVGNHSACSQNESVFRRLVPAGPFRPISLLRQSTVSSCLYLGRKVASWVACADQHPAESPWPTNFHLAFVAQLLARYRRLSMRWPGLSNANPPYVCHRCDKPGSWPSGSPSPASCLRPILPPLTPLTLQWTTRSE